MESDARAPEAVEDGAVRPEPKRRDGSLPAWRIGLAGGLVGLVCCVGPTVLALLGVVSGATALAWGNDLYDGYAWWFRLAGLMTLALLVVVALRRRNACSIRGVRAQRLRILSALAIAVVTYAALYAGTTALGALA